MKRSFVAIVFCTMVLLTLSTSLATINLNSSKSNIYRIVFAADVVTQTQGDAMVKELEKRGPLTEAEAKKWLAANFKTFGIDGTRVKEIDVFLQQQISCTASAETCKGKYVGHSNLGGNTARKDLSRVEVAEEGGDCLCFESITTPTQVQRVNKTDSIVTIFLLSDPAQKADAFANAHDAASMEREPAYISSREQARQVFGKGGNSSAKQSCCCYFFYC